MSFYVIFIGDILERQALVQMVHISLAQRRPEEANCCCHALEQWTVCAWRICWNWTGTCSIRFAGRQHRRTKRSSDLTSFWFWGTWLGSSWLGPRDTQWHFVDSHGLDHRFPALLHPLPRQPSGADSHRPQLHVTYDALDYWRSGKVESAKVYLIHGLCLKICEGGLQKRQLSRLNIEQLKL